MIDQSSISKSTSSRAVGSLVAEDMARRVCSGDLQPGDILPPETEIAAQFHISRASVRTALKTLETLGIIVRQAGRGTTVQEFREWNFLDPQVSQWIATYAAPNLGVLHDVFEFRCTTEPLIASLAARRANARDLLAMEEAFEIMEQNWERRASHGERDPFSTADIAFHEAIYRATHNLVWAQIVHILRPAILLVIRTSNETAEELRESLERHRRLMESIRMRDAEAAYTAAGRILSQTGFDLGFEETPGAKEILTHIRAGGARTDP
ncbi:DNA-binding transcriptional regulator, FadR family [Cohaesibacter sp. ES.047]|uniref:FadR/GntR family transcriptional regulator n=1 Tax=Cohaesibacter sp. ES.047 TaxID=1798205 RepID=UPI000BB8C6B8|nr:FadR/GntR family transcriptional regulator [Cohaesibacter sp. ES.047]SNY89965.1 DNA-binding transcriptional regulator, FadR family [Cohaesibacter sp. ES.047]